MRTWRRRCNLRIDLSLEELEAAYAAEVGWKQHSRVNLDARLVLLGLQRLSKQGIGEQELTEAAFVLGCELGSMESYEAFDRSLATRQPTPLTFSQALPSTPLSTASVRFGLRGLTCTLVGGSNVAERAMQIGGRWLAQGRARIAVVGQWCVPSETAIACGLGCGPSLSLSVLEVCEHINVVQPRDRELCDA